MKQILFALALIVSITACTKPETPNPESEPIPESYVGYKRSEHPNIKISGISVNGIIVYDIKSAVSYCSPDFYLTVLHSKRYTYSDISNDYESKIIPKVEISISGTLFQLYIHEDTINGNDIIHCKTSYNDEPEYNTDNVESFKFKDTSFNINLVKHENGILYGETDTCGFDVEVTMKNGDIIEVVYYGESIHQYIMGGIK